MSISVRHDKDVYSFASKDGKSYWYLSECQYPSFSKMVGMIVNFDMVSTLYRAAFNQGYTESDFEKMRTYTPTKTRVSSASYKSSKIPKSRIAKEPKTPARKTTLSQSIKLF
jgi:hypothetical protein